MTSRPVQSCDDDPGKGGASLSVGSRPRFRGGQWCVKTKRQIVGRIFNYISWTVTRKGHEDKRGSKAVVPKQMTLCCWRGRIAPLIRGSLYNSPIRPELEAGWAAETIFYDWWCLTLSKWKVNNSNRLWPHKTTIFWLLQIAFMGPRAECVKGRAQPASQHLFSRPKWKGAHMEDIRFVLRPDNVCFRDRLNRLKR